MRNLVDGVKKYAAAGLLAITLVLSGCGAKDLHKSREKDFLDITGREKISLSTTNFPRAAASKGFRHEIYKTSACKKIEEALDSDVILYKSPESSSVEFRMRIYGEDRGFLGEYRIIKAHGVNKRTELYDSNGKKIKTFEGKLPRGLADRVFLTTDEVKYYRIGEEIELNRELIRKNFLEHLKSDKDKKLKKSE